MGYSTAPSNDQLSEAVWHRPAKSNVENAVSRLIHDWGVPIVKISFHEIRTELRDQQPTAIHASTATAQPEDRPISLFPVSMPLRED
jgi:hypothetical protein